MSSGNYDNAVSRLAVMKVVIIGGVAAGASAAARIRRLDEDAEIVVLERTGYVSYANCGLPYYVGGIIEDRGALTLQTPGSFASRFAVDVRVRSEAVRIDRASKTVRVRSLTSGEEYDESYDYLIICTGAKALMPEMGGADDPRVLTLRTVEDCLAMHDLARRPGVRRAVVAGGGYIGLEAAENLRHLGLEVTILQRSSQILPPADIEIAAEAASEMRRNGVAIRYGASVAGFRGGDVLEVLLADGTSMKADMAVIALGVVPDTQLAKDCGLELGVKGAIRVDGRMRTSDPCIFAAGDAVSVTDPLTGRESHIALAGPANKQGRIAADCICGRDSEYHGTVGTSVIKVFDMTIAFTGLSEKSAKAAGIVCDKAFTYSSSHASYYPGARSMSVKTVFDPDTGRILGAQIAGYEGVDKRIDILSVAVRAGMTAKDLEGLELSYAPPYSSAKDPVNMAGFVISNLVDGLVRQVHWEDIPAVREAPEVVMLDIRTEGEFAEYSIPGSINIPLDSLRERLSELDVSRRYCLICRTGLRSYIGCRMMVQHGYDCFHLAGGVRLYRAVMEGIRSGGESLPCGAERRPGL